MPFCPKCGKEVKEDSAFCSNCGNPLSNGQDNLDSNSEHAEYVEFSNYQEKESSLCKVSMILGIISIVFSTICCCCFPVSAITGPIAIILAIIYLVKYPNKSKSQAIVGLVLGIIATVIAIYMCYSMMVFDPNEVKDILMEYCETDPNSDECKIIKDSFPDWFK